jgi:RHS repeat-associated protein
MNKLLLSLSLTACLNVLSQAPKKTFTEKLDGIKTSSKELTKSASTDNSSVGQSGTMSTTVPLVTVTSKTMTFTLQLNYTAGITVSQSSGAVGLGWDMAGGSIVRDFGAFEPDYSSTQNEARMLRTGSGPAGWLNTNNVGKNPTWHNQVLGYNVFSPNERPIPLSDFYHINVSGLGSNTFYNNGSVGGNHNWVLTEFENWKIKHTLKTYIIDQEYSRINEINLSTMANGSFSSSDDKSCAAAIGVLPYVIGGSAGSYDPSMVTKVIYEDFEKFIITAEDGTQYIFGRALRGQKFVFSNDPYWSSKMNPTEISSSANGNFWKIDYIAEWLLTEIRSVDFVDANQNGVADDGDGGDWIVFNYTAEKQTVETAPRFTGTKFKSDVPKHREWSSYSQTDQASSLMRERAYLTKIETPVQYVDFTISQRFDVEHDYYNKPANRVGNQSYYENRLVGTPPPGNGRITDFDIVYPIETMKYDRIKVYSKLIDKNLYTTENLLVQSVVLNYAAKGSAQELAVSEYLIRNNDNTPKMADATNGIILGSPSSSVAFDIEAYKNSTDKRGKTTLLSIDLYGGSEAATEKTSYKFEYAYNPSFNEIHKREIIRKWSMPSLRQGSSEFNSPSRNPKSTYTIPLYKEEVLTSAGVININAPTITRNDISVQNFLIDIPYQEKYYKSQFPNAIDLTAYILQNSQYPVNETFTSINQILRPIVDVFDFLYADNCSQCPKAWSLTKITYPTGGEVSFEYEQGSFEKEVDKNRWSFDDTEIPIIKEYNALARKRSYLQDAWNQYETATGVDNLAGRRKQLTSTFEVNLPSNYGIRLKSKSINDKINPIVVINYAYQKGHFTSLPSKYLQNVLASFNMFIIRENERHSWETLYYGYHSDTEQWSTDYDQKMKFLSISGIELDEYTSTHFYEIIDTKNSDNSFERTTFGPIGSTDVVKYEEQKLYCTKLPYLDNDNGSYIITPTKINRFPVYPEITTYFDANSATPYKTVTSTYTYQPILSYSLQVDYRGGIGTNPNTVTLWDNTFETYKVTSDGLNNLFGVIYGRTITDMLKLPYNNDAGVNAYAYERWTTAKTVLNETKTTYKGIISSKKYTYNQTDYTLTAEENDFPSTNTKHITTYEYANATYGTLTNKFEDLNLKQLPTRVNTYLNNVSPSTAISAKMTTYDYSFPVPKIKDNYAYETAAVNATSGVFSMVDFNIASATNPNWRIEQNTNFEYNKHGDVISSKTNRLFNKMVYGNNLNTVKAQFSFPDAKFDATYSGFEDFFGFHEKADWNNQEYKNETWFLEPTITPITQTILLTAATTNVGNCSTYTASPNGGINTTTFYHIVTLDQITNLKVGSKITVEFTYAGITTTTETTIAAINTKADLNAAQAGIGLNALNYILTFSSPVLFNIANPHNQIFTLKLTASNVNYNLSRTYTRTGEYSYKLPTKRAENTPFNTTPFRSVKLISQNVSGCNVIYEEEQQGLQLKSAQVPANCLWNYEASVWLKYDFDIPQALIGRDGEVSAPSSSLSGDTKYLRGTITETNNGSLVKIICDVYNSAKTMLIEQKVFYVVGLDNQWRQFTVEIPVLKNGDRWLDVYVVNERSQIQTSTAPFRYSSVFVDDIAIYPKGAKYNYSTINKFGATTFEVDNNDVFTETIYDAKARPIASINQYGSKTKGISYFELPNWTNQQNHISETNWIDNGVYNQTRTYIDGFGKTKQSITADLTKGTRLITETNIYNAKGQVVQAYKPYVLQGATLSAGYDANFVAKTVEFYGSNFAFNQATYEPKPESVIASFSEPRTNTETAITSAQSEYICATALTNTNNNVIFPANSLLIHQLIKANGNITRTYIDAMGRVIMEEHQIGADHIQNTDGSISLITSPDVYAQTWYQYDQAGRLTKVFDPERKTSVYTYNSLGILIKSFTPDKGTAELRYDQFGQVRFVRNQKDIQAVSTSIYGTDQFKYSKYDAWGRVTESGMLNAAPNTPGLNTSSLPFPAQIYFDNTTVINDQNFPLSTQKLIQVYVQNSYDGTRSLFNSNSLLTETSISAHTLTSNYMYTSSVADKKHYSYMADGQLAKIGYEYNDLAGIHAIEPIYNGMRIATGKKYTHPTQSTYNFVWTTELDNFGRPKVNKNTHNGVTTQTGQYYYDIFGNLLMQGLGKTTNTANPHIDYTVYKQNIRNQVVNQMTKNLRIGLTYDLVGNITNQYWSSEQFDPTTGTTFNVNQYQYYYDKMNRLQGADYKKGTYTQNPFAYFASVSATLPSDFNVAVDQTIFKDRTAAIYAELNEVIKTSSTPEVARGALSALNLFQVEYYDNNVSYETMTAADQDEFLTNYIAKAIREKSHPIYYEVYMATKFADQAHLTALNSGTFGTAKLKYMKQLVANTTIPQYQYYYPNSQATVYGYLPDFQQPANITNGTPYDEAFWYSKNGNTTKANRNNETGLKTQQIYSYANSLDNKLTSVSFTVLTATPTTTTTNYTYDLVGNLKNDARNGVSDISYISFNDMPQSITNASGTKNYRYDNAGQRTVKINSPTDLEFYIDDVILEQSGRVKSYQTNEGYAVPLPTGTSVNYFYNLKDWLGTNRVVLDATGTRVNVTDHYAYGLKMPARNYSADVEGNRYQFTGHQFDGETNYEYHGARYYNRELGRYMSVDPLAVQRMSLTPYNYVSCNPVMRIDPDGALDTKFVDDEGNTIVETDDKSKEVFVIHEKDKDSFIQDLGANAESHKDKIVSENNKLGEKYGVKLSELVTESREKLFEDNQEFKMGYKLTYDKINKNSLVYGAAGIGITSDKGGSLFTLGAIHGKEDAKAGKMNVFKPKIKNNKAEYTIGEYTKEIIKMGDKITVERRGLLKN